MRALIDSDTIAYASAATAEGQGEQIACWNANAMVEDTLRKLNTRDFQLYLTGEGNFRYQIYPEYKANRIKMQRPAYLQAVKSHLVAEWGAVVAQGCEADDLLGIEQCQAEDETIIVSIDKDLDQIPGWHYNPKKEIEYIISPLDGLRFFYYQLLVGDTADNIKGALGIGPKKATKILEGLSDEYSMYLAVRDQYRSDEELIMNARCLYIWHKEDDEWTPPNDPTISEEQGENTTETST